jgi:hypothetical protein
MPFPSLDVSNKNFALDTFLKYPCIVAPTGTVQNSGNTITFGTSLTRTYSAGLWVYLPTMTTGGTGLTAGWWHVIPSSATVATIVGTRQAYPNNTPDLSAFDVLVDSAYTGETAAVTVQQITLPAGLLGTAGQLLTRVGMFKSATASGTTGFKVYVGNSTTPTSNALILATSMATTTLAQTAQGTLQMLGATNNALVLASSATGFSASTAAPLYSSQDSSLVMYQQITLTNTLATEYIGVFSVNTEVIL